MAGRGTYGWGLHGVRNRRRPVRTTGPSATESLKKIENEMDRYYAAVARGEVRSIDEFRAKEGETRPNE